MANPLDEIMGGSPSAGRFERVPIKATPELRRNDFLTDFFTRFGGNGNSFGNPNYRNSLEGYFQAPFEDIGGTLSKVNTFLPKNPAPYGYRDVYKPGKGGGNNDFMSKLGLPGGGQGGFPFGKGMGGGGGGGMPMPDMFGLNIF